MRHVFITGANRGIGLALTRHLLEQGEHVIATARRPEQARSLHELQARFPNQLVILPLDVTDEEQIQVVARSLEAITSHIDWLINNAGVLYEGESIRTLPASNLLHSFQVNAIGPMMVVKHLLPMLERSSSPLICQMTSMMGSITLAAGDRHYSYRGSKAALNMLSRVLSFELKPLGIPVILMHPGWVRTDMGGPAAPLSPEESAAGIVRVLRHVTLEDSGRFLTWEGRELPW
ncbi:MAG: SDR family oxidoreductase [Chloroflexi bacterium]|nr:SDR family oxidoreductase [Chloroflexota bacterium]